MEQDQKKRPRRAFTSDFKAEAVRLSKSGGRSVGQVVRELGIVESNLRNWIRQADVDSGAESSGSLTTDERNELTRLRRAFDDGEGNIKKRNGLLGARKHVKFTFIASEKAAFPVSMLCRMLGVSRSGFHGWQNRRPSARQVADSFLRVAIAAAYRRGQHAYGSPRVHRELRIQGIRVGRKRVERLMRESGLRARGKRRFRKTTDSKHSYVVSPNH